VRCAAAAEGPVQPDSDRVRDFGLPAPARHIGSSAAVIGKPENLLSCPDKFRLHWLM
jgi:hypothetical protein